MGTVVDDVNSSSTSNGFVPFSLDLSHPFYIHPSDNPGSQLVSVPFNGCGFVLWRNSMLTSLSAKNKHNLLDDRVNKPTPESPYYPHWERCNDMVKAWITNSVSREIAISFLNGLNDSYTTVKSAIMLINPLPPISKAYSLLQQDESQREAHSVAPNFSGDATSFLVSPSASTTNRTFSQKVNFEARKSAPNVSCKYCKKPGHTVDKCYRLHGFPTDFKFTKSKKYASCVQTESPSTTAVTTTSQYADSSAHGFTKEQYQHLLTLFQQVQMSNTSTHDASNMDQSAFAHFAGLFSKYAVDSKVSHVCASSQLGVNPWILDIGATNHMTPHKHLLFNVQSLIKPFLVTLPNGYKAKVVSTGSLYFRHDMILLHVLLGPSLKRPLEIGKAAGRLYYLHPDGDLFPVPSDSLNVSSSSLPSSVSTSSDLPSSASIVSDKSSHIVTHVNGTPNCLTMLLNLVEVLKPPSSSQAKAFSIRPLFLAPLNKMGWLKGNTNTYWKSPGLFFFSLTFLSNIGGECVLTATYLINRLPSVVLKGISPYEKLHGLPPLYDHLKSFGCGFS
ncbi:uncharacterized protein [Nicotiana sylvestris]|uniref:uncharacterized protein n=1 Tax=Nicotiana sylvestris TaxID=4096 RepID=UPI00388C8A40